jgi:TctA family transporter
MSSRGFRFRKHRWFSGLFSGRLAETSFLRGLIRYDNAWTIFFRRPISCTLLIMAIVAFAILIVSRIRQQRSLVSQ